MKKLILGLLMMIPTISFADMDLDIRNQMLDSEIEKYTKTRDEKYTALLDCEKSTKGFKIAGITTLIATGVGVYGNVKLAQKLQGTSGSRGGGNARVIDNRPQEEKNDDSCGVLCEVGAAPAECGC